MLMYERHRELFRFLTFVTLMFFLPCGLDVYRWVPAVVVVQAHADEPDTTAEGSTTTLASAEPGLLVPLAIPEPTTTAEAGPDSANQEAPVVASRETAPLFSALIPGESEALRVAQAEPVEVEQAPTPELQGFELAESFRANGEWSRAYETYVALLNACSNPGLQDAIDARDAIKAVALDATPSQLTDMASRLATGAAPQSATALRGANELYRVWAERCLRDGDTNGFQQYTRLVMERSWEGMAEYVSDAHVRVLFTPYLESAQALGEDEAALSALRGFLGNQPPSLTTFTGWVLVGKRSRELNDGAAPVYFSNALQALENRALEAFLDDPASGRNAKALLEQDIAELYEAVGRYPEAVAQYKRVQERYPVPGKRVGKNDPCYESAWLEARLVAKMNGQDYFPGILAYNAMIDRYPESTCVPIALNEMAGLYMLAGDFRQASQYFRHVVAHHGGTPSADTAQAELAFIAAYFTNAVELAESGRAPRLEQWCGPLALHKMLALNGIKVSIDTLAQQAAADHTGTSMLALVETARGYGLTLNGVESADLAAMPRPFVAYVGRNHFVVVRDLVGDRVALSDMGGPEILVARADFARLWDGKSLVLGNGLGFTRLMDTDALKGARGGCSGSYNHNPPECESNGGCPKCPNGGGPSNENDPACAGGGMTSSDGAGGSGGVERAGERCGKSESRTPHSSTPCRVPPCVQSPTVSTGVSGDGYRLIVAPMSSSFQLVETDLSVPVKGNLNLAFSRTYRNVMGQTLQAAHNLGISIQCGWSAADYTDEKGVSRTYLGYTDGIAGMSIYSQTATTGSSLGRQSTLEWNRNTGRATLHHFPEDLYYDFDVNYGGYGQLDAIRDAEGNQLSFYYDGGVPSKLTKVAAPSGDDRALHLSYSGSVLTKVELKDGAALLDQVTYAEGTGTLTVTDNDGRSIQHTWGGPQKYLSSLTGKDGNTTNLTWTYAGTQATKIEVTNAEGMTTTFDRSLSSGVCALTTWDGATNLSKRVMTPIAASDTSRLTAFDFYKDATTYERWGFTYDASGDLLTKTRPGGGVIAAYTYTSMGQVSTVTAPGRATKIFTYGSGPYPVTASDGAGVSVNYEYNASNILTKVVTPTSGANGWQYGYAAGGLLTSSTDPLGHTISYAYDARGTMTQVTDALSNTTTYEYDFRGQMTRVRDARNKDTYFGYAADGCGCGGAGKLTKVTNALGYETEYRYDGNGKLTKTIDALDREADVAYDTMGRMTRVTSPSGSSSSTLLAYDKLGQLTSQTDVNGKTTAYAYDHVGRQTRVTDPLGALSSTSLDHLYDGGGNLLTVTDNAGHATHYEYDLAHALTKVTYGNGKVTRYFYDTVGRLTKTGAGASGTTDPTERFYSATTGLLTRVRYTSGANTADADYFYDAALRLTKLTDWIDGTDGLRYGYDAAGRLTSLTDYDDSVLEYVYDAAGNVLTMEDYHGSVTAYTYTDTNQLSTLTAPGSKTWDYDYNALGQPTQVSIPNGMTTAYAYDTRNRLTKIEHKDGAAVLNGWTYALDDRGNITRTDQADGSYWTYGYDGRYRLTTADRYEASGSSIRAQYAYGYDLADNLTAKTEPFLDDFEDGNYTGWSSGGGWSATTKVLKESYSTSTRITRNNGQNDVDLRFRYMTTDTTAGLFGEMCFRTSSTNALTNNTVLRMATDGMKLQKVVAGVVTVLDSEPSATATANTWYRVRILAKGTNVTVWRGEGDDGPMEEVLSSASVPTLTTVSMWFISGASAAFAYDDVAIVANGWTSDTTFATNSGNELTSSTFGGVTTTYGYDAWGNMTSKARGSYTATYAWYYGGKLIGVTSTFPSEGTVTYAYGGDGKRRERDDGATVTWYNWDMDWTMINEENAAGALTTTFVRMPSGLVGPMVADVAGSNPATGTYRYFSQDNLSSTRELRDASKIVLGQREYTPYGSGYCASGATPLHGFTGHQWDTANDLYYAPYRYYSPEFARWLSRDPLGAVDGPNVYQYVLANPVKSVDPLGLFIPPPPDIFNGPNALLCFLDRTVGYGTCGLLCNAGYGYASIQVGLACRLLRMTCVNWHPEGGSDQADCLARVNTYCGRLNQALDKWFSGCMKNCWDTYMVGDHCCN